MAEPDKPRRDPRLERLTATPELFLKDFNPERDLAVLSPMSEASYRDSVFMDDRLVRSEARDLAVSLNALGRVWQHSAAAARAIHYIGHMGHCGSTLLSRILGELAGLHSLREPPVFMGLSRALRHLDTPDFDLTRFEWSQLLELAALMMQRTWRDSDVSVIKPTSATGNLLPHLLNRTGIQGDDDLIINRSQMGDRYRSHRRLLTIAGTGRSRSSQPGRRPIGGQPCCPVSWRGI